MIGIIGAGAWGTAIAIAISRTHREILLWTRNIQLEKILVQQRENTLYLPKYKLPLSVQVTSNFASLKNCSVLLIATPINSLKRICNELKELNIDNTLPIIICSKGILYTTRAVLPSEIVKSICGNPVAVLSGANFACEIAADLPAQANLACEDVQLMHTLSVIFCSSNFYVHTTTDLIGTQICGAVKNVLAIACGIARGQRLGQNAQAIIITKGLTEMQMLCLAKGGQISSVMSICGIGDLVLTCTSEKSRNTSFGKSLTNGSLKKEITCKHTIEGYYSSYALDKMIQELKITLPLCNLIYKIMYEKLPCNALIKILMK